MAVLQACAGEGVEDVAGEELQEEGDRVWPVGRSLAEQEVERADHEHALDEEGGRAVAPPHGVDERGQHANGEGDRDGACDGTARVDEHRLLPEGRDDQEEVEGLVQPRRRARIARLEGRGRRHFASGEGLK